MTATTTAPRPISRASAHDLVDLADRVRRLAPSHRDPEQFHIDKDAIVTELRRLAWAISA